MVHNSNHFRCNWSNSIILFYTMRTSTFPWLFIIMCYLQQYYKYLEVDLIGSKAANQKKRKYFKIFLYFSSLGLGWNPGWSLQSWVFCLAIWAITPPPLLFYSTTIHTLASMLKTFILLITLILREFETAPVVIFHRGWIFKLGEKISRCIIVWKFRWPAFGEK